MSQENTTLRAWLSARVEQRIDTPEQLALDETQEAMVAQDITDGKIAPPNEQYNDWLITKQGFGKTPTSPLPETTTSICQKLSQLWKTVPDEENGQPKRVDGVNQELLEHQANILASRWRYLVKDLVHPWTKSTRQRAKLFPRFVLSQLHYVHFAHCV